MIHSEFYRPALFEEIAGPFDSLTEQDEFLEVQIGKIRLALPVSLKQSLLPLVGKKISILRTDLAHREYLFRILGSDKPSDDMPG